MRRHVWCLAPLLGVLLLTQPRALAVRGDLVPRGVPQAPICATDHVWQQKRAALGLSKGAACAPEGECDDPAIRDAIVRHPFTVRLLVHVMNSSAGDPPSGIVQADVDTALVELNERYAPYNISFELVGTRYHDDDDFHCIAALSFFNDDWRIDIENMKLAYAEDPWTQLNVFVGCQTSSIFGVLGGYAIFPWDTAALTHLGGLWVNSDYFGAGKTVLTHEIGHCLGLWHSHRGVSETTDCDDPCTENVHAPDATAADLVGDFCKDTPATPPNGDCADPVGVDCDSVAWGATDFTNYMGYADETCVDHFTPEQVDRMHCWSRNAIAALIEEHVTLVHVQTTQVVEEVDGNLRRALGTVRVIDPMGVPVAGVSVRARWLGTYTAQVLAETEPSGTAAFQTPWISVAKACWTLEVLDLTSEGFVYDRKSNVAVSHTTGEACGRRPGVKGPYVNAVPRLEAIKPNPFNPATTIVFSLPEAATVQLDVYDVAGRLVRTLLNAPRAAGTHEVLWTGRDDHDRAAASGVYVAVLRVGDLVLQHRMVLLK
jgi:hypothetical protein